MEKKNLNTVEKKKMNLDIGYELPELIDFLIEAGKKYNVSYRFENETRTAHLFFLPNITFFGNEENLKKLYVEEFEPDYSEDFSDVIEEIEENA